MQQFFVEQQGTEFVELQKGRHVVIVLFGGDGQGGEEQGRAGGQGGEVPEGVGDRHVPSEQRNVPTGHLGRGRQDVMEGEEEVEDRTHCPFQHFFGKFVGHGIPFVEGDEVQFGDDQQTGFPVALTHV